METPKIKLVPIPTSDSKALKWLHQFIHQHHSSPKWVLPSIDQLKYPQLRFFKAVIVAPSEHKGEIAGVSSYEIRTRFLVETQKTIVDPHYRGQGIGKLISEAMEQLIRKKGIKKIRTTIYSSNVAMLSIKLAQGFVIEGFHPDHDAPGLHEYSLGKKLD